MALSHRAKRMLERGTRYPHPGDRVTIVACLEREGWPVFEPVVEFEERFGGVEYHIYGDGREGLRLGLVLPMWNAATGTSETGTSGWVENGRYYFECAHPFVACPCELQIDQDGALCADFQPIASTVERHVESDAVLDELGYEQDRWLWLLFGVKRARDRQVDENLQRLGLSLVPEATDAYTTWWRDDGLRVHRHVFWDGTGTNDRLVAYARTEHDPRRLVDALRETSYGREPTRYQWPPRPFPRTTA